MLRRLLDWIVTDWEVTHLAGPRWRWWLWQPVVIPLSIWANFPRTTIVVALLGTLWCMHWWSP